MRERDVGLARRIPRVSCGELKCYSRASHSACNNSVRAQVEAHAATARALRMYWLNKWIRLLSKAPVFHVWSCLMQAEWLLSNTLGTGLSATPHVAA